MMMEEDGSLELGARLNNRPHGKSITITSDGDIYLNYNKDGD